MPVQKGRYDQSSHDMLCFYDPTAIPCLCVQSNATDSMGKRSLAIRGMVETTCTTKGAAFTSAMVAAIQLPAVIEDTHYLATYTP